MNMVPSILLDKELRVSDFKLSSEYFKNFSFLFYGFELKSEYDERRYQIHKSLKPKKFAHLVKTKEGMRFKYFYGIILPGNKTYNKIAKQLAFASHKEEYTLSFKNYEHMMSEFNIETSCSYGKYSVGVYPFDNISDMCDKQIDQNKFFANKNIPMFQRLGGLSSYIICNTENLIKYL